MTPLARPRSRIGNHFEKLRAMFAHEGVAHPFHPGVRTEDDVEACLAGLGITRIATERFGGVGRLGRSRRRGWLLGQPNSCS